MRLFTISVVLLLAHAKCPLEDSGCPLYKSSDAGGAAAAGCPAAKGCPYYDNHKTDKTELDAVDKACPLAAAKCIYLIIYNIL
jgi:hypothetical protein